MIEFVVKYESRPYEPTGPGHRVATAMTDFFTRRWFPAPLRFFPRDLIRYLAGERVSRLHRLGWMTPRREHLVRNVLKLPFRTQQLVRVHRYSHAGDH